MNNSPSGPTDDLLSSADLKELAFTFRPGTVEDSYTVFTIFEAALADLARRMGSSASFSIDDPAALARMWEERRSLYEHLACTAEQFWLAERGGRAVGFSRSIERDGTYELTELFILPGEQSAGLGRQLLTRAFPPGSARRSIIASSDLRAQVLYLKAGLHVRFPVYYFWRQPEAVPFKTDLDFKPIQASAETVAELATIDELILGRRRDADHGWLLSNRQGYLYHRGDRTVGYGYLGSSNGPFALLAASDYPAVLAHAESEAAAAGRRHIGLEVPMINQAAVNYLLGRGCRIDSFVAMYMSDKSVGTFDKYLLATPPFFL